MESAAYWIQKLKLTQHPEGGYYRETYRSQEKVRTKVGIRSSATSIYFLLEGENISHFHQLTSDELWYYHHGSSTIIHMIDQDGNYNTEKLGRDHDTALQILIPAGVIFAAEVEDKKSYALMGCVVSPGFDFADFKLYAKNELLALHPEHEAIIKRFT